jgi:hypothetical protein
MIYLKTFEIFGLFGTKKKQPEPTIDTNPIVDEVFTFLEKATKLINDKYSVFCEKDIIRLYYKQSKDITENISKITITENNMDIFDVKFNSSILKFEIYNSKYELNSLLINYFTDTLKTLEHYLNIEYSFKYEENKLNINSFEIILNINKFNI